MYILIDVMCMNYDWEKASTFLRIFDESTLTMVRF